jgi:D-alanyl-D-alanine carboxypeptidase
MSRRQRGTATVLSAIICVALAGATLVGSSCAPPFSKATQDKLAAALDKVMVQGKLPGAVAGVWVPSQGTWVVANGVADFREGTMMKLPDKLRIASITKTFTATMVLQLVDEGKVKLDDKLAKYVPEAPNAQNITIEQLLNHTSGIRDEDPNGTLHFQLKNDPLKQWKPLEVVEAYTGGKVQGEAGKEYEYSNAGYVLLGMVIEKASGRAVAEFLQKKIAAPLGLKSTHFPDGPDITGEFAHGYDGVTDVTRMDMSWDFTAGALISNLEDLHTWAKALATGKLLSNKIHEAQLTWVDIPGGQGQIKAGLGIEDEFGYLGHSGDNLGYQSNMKYLPDKDATIVVLFNKSSSNGEDRQSNERAFVWLSDVVFTGKIPAWYKQAIALPPPQ